MKGFKNSTKTVHLTGSSPGAKGAAGMNAALSTMKARTTETPSRPLTSSELKRAMPKAESKASLDRRTVEKSSRPFARGGKVGC